MRNIFSTMPPITTDNLTTHPIGKWYKEIYGKDLESLAQVYIYNNPKTILDVSIDLEEFPNLKKNRNSKGVRLNRQISKWFHKLWNYKLTQKELSEIGNVLDSKEGETIIYFRVFNPRKEKIWLAGEYGDSNSCFWNGRVDARETIISNEKFKALLFYKKNPPAEFLTDHTHLYMEGYTLGRCWLFERTNGGYILFNGYFNGKNLTLFNLKEAISEFLDTDFEYITLINKGHAKDRIWINEEGHGYLFSDDASEIASIDLNTDIVRIKCTHCGEEDTPQNFVTKIVDNEEHTLCQQCVKLVKQCAFSEKLSFHPYNVWTTEDRPTQLCHPDIIEEMLKAGKIVFIKRHGIYVRPSYAMTVNGQLEWTEDLIYSHIMHQYILREDAVIFRDAEGEGFVTKEYLKKGKNGYTKNERTDVSSGEGLHYEVSLFA
jgi:hypothetical protein